MNWRDWSTGSTTWQFGPLVPNEVLYEYAGPVIFTSDVGLQTFLFYKSAEHDDGDYFIAVPTTPDIIRALKAGDLSMRGALTQPECWIMDIDLDLEIRRFERKPFNLFDQLVPAPGVSLRHDVDVAPDSLEQLDSALSIKYFGHELKNGVMPLDIFKGLVLNTYDMIRRSFVPPRLAATNAADLLSFPMRQPLLASLMIAIDHPEIDVGRLRRRDRTKAFDAHELELEAEIEGAKFVESFAKSIDMANSGNALMQFASTNIELFDALNVIVPGEVGDVSKVQLASSLNGGRTFFEVDREVGAKIKHAYKRAKDSSVVISGRISGMIARSGLLMVKPDRGLEVTCYVDTSIYQDMVARGELAIGREVSVSGTFEKRKIRDLMWVDGRPRMI